VRCWRGHRGRCWPPTAARARALARPSRDAAGFLWGAAISAHQSEGGNVNSDSWLLEHLPETVYKEPSGDACDSYRRYEQDFAIARSIGLNCYRFGIEWARIEPEPGLFSQAALDHYEAVLAACLAHGLCRSSLQPFTVPRWFAMRGGWEQPGQRRPVRALLRAGDAHARRPDRNGHALQRGEHQPAGQGAQDDVHARLPWPAQRR
jgi:hypothetical protein